MAGMKRWAIVLKQALVARKPRRIDLLEALDVVNPTPHDDLDDEERDARYVGKAKLQTRLIEAFGRRPRVA